MAPIAPAASGSLCHGSPPHCSAERPDQGAPVDVAGLLTTEGAARRHGTLRSLAGQFANQPGVVSLSGGFPPPALFPIAGLSLRMASGGTVEIGDPDSVGAAQQYNFSLRGYQPLLQWVQRHTEDMHAPPPRAAHETLVTNGGNHTLEMIFSLFLDRGDSLLVEEYTYPVVTESLAQPRGVHTVPVPIDAHGIVPEELEQVLAGLHAAAATGGRPAPKLLYTVPTGQNPTGCSISEARRARVYRACERYNLLLVEDDPYFYLQFPQGPVAVPGLLGLRRSGSYLSLDTDGRVIRIDSFAKFLAPGMRLGWVTAHPDIVDKMTMIIQAHTVGPCSLSQVVTWQILQHWGEEGLHAHLRTVQREYAQRAACIVAACQEHLAGYAEWSLPQAGMFLWLRLLTVRDSTEVWEALKAAKIVLLPGRVTHCRAHDPAFHSPYVRVSYSCDDEATLQEGMRRLGSVLRAHRSTVVSAAAAAAAAAEAATLTSCAAADEDSCSAPTRLLSGDDSSRSSCMFQLSPSDLAQFAH